MPTEFGKFELSLLISHGAAQTERGGHVFFGERSVLPLDHDHVQRLKILPSPIWYACATTAAFPCHRSKIPSVLGLGTRPHGRWGACTENGCPAQPLCNGEQAYQARHLECVILNVRCAVSSLTHSRPHSIEVAGGLITPESQDAAPADRKFVGSVLLYEADSIEDVRKLVEQDIYWTENVVSWSTVKPIQLDPKHPH